MQILLILAAGMLIGRLLASRRKILVLASRGATWSLYLLICLLGLSVGADRAIMSALSRLGVQAAVLCAGAILGSVLAAAYISPRISIAVPREK